MTIWIFNPYGSLPGEGWRAYRSTMIADAFNKHGHQVVWFTSTFEHRSKNFRSDTWKDIQVNDLYKIVLVPSSAYKAHISWARIKSERKFAYNLRTHLLANSDKPDLVIIAEPAIFIADILMDITRKKKVKFIVDIIDLWPELFNIILPSSVSASGKLLFAPMYWRRASFIKKAAGLIAVAKDYLEIGKKYNPTPYAEVVYWGVDTKSIMEASAAPYEDKALDKLVKQPGEKWVIYAGTLGDNYDLKTIVHCGSMLEASKLNVRILIAGDGSLREFIETYVQQNQLKKTQYIGRLSANDLNQLYMQCDMALSSYVKRSTVSMSVKTYDYLCAGLPLINSLGRDLGDFVTTKKIGLQYEAENAPAMFEAIRLLSQDDALRNNMRNNALALAHFFDANVQYDKLVTLSKRIVEEA